MRVAGHAVVLAVLAMSAVLGQTPFVTSIVPTKTTSTTLVVPTTTTPSAPTTFTRTTTVPPPATTKPTTLPPPPPPPTTTRPPTALPSTLSPPTTTEPVTPPPTPTTANASNATDDAIDVGSSDPSHHPGGSNPPQQNDSATPSPLPSTTTTTTGGPSSITIVLATLCSVAIVGGLLGIYCIVFRNTAPISEYNASMADIRPSCFPPVALLEEATTLPLSTTTTMCRSLFDEITAAHPHIEPKSLVCIEQVGAGALCDVWLAMWKPHSSMVAAEVAVKRLRGKRRTERDVEMFLEDTRLLATLRHPSILPVIGLVWHSKVHVEVVLEFMDAGNLRHVLSQSNPLAMGWLGTKQDIAMDVVDALVFLHHEQIVHQKLTADTVLLHTHPARDGSGRGTLRAKLGNCGASVHAPPSEHPNLITSLARRWSTFALSPIDAVTVAALSQRRKWMAPEVLRGEAATSASDMYAFGVLLSTLDTHDDPYKRETDLDEALLLQRVSFGALRPTLSLLCPPLIHDIAQSCLDSSPMERPTAAQVAGYLRAPSLCSPSASAAIPRSKSRRGSLPSSLPGSYATNSLPSLSLSSRS
ncbi:Aste57867_19634 [Aphanomyces stellatus]|uniref:Aste57867_19634 protein n=1 Tax=Aphanomyces stellatus TaxID=120398 RepID=A0A485LDJ7_9STRA|nr:hypothetical protein As57867_019569 [Aphanomyces stellatus]VFT96334.1 Aste57867_19634 [Aphanomyces stellatus]